MMKPFQLKPEHVARDRRGRQFLTLTGLQEMQIHVGEEPITLLPGEDPVHFRMRVRNAMRDFFWQWGSILEIKEIVEENHET